MGGQARIGTLVARVMKVELFRDDPGATTGGGRIEQVFERARQELSADAINIRIPIEGADIGLRAEGA